MRNKGCAFEFGRLADYGRVWYGSRMKFRYEFLVGSPPFEDESKKATYQKIKNVDVKFPSFLSRQAISLIRVGLFPEPQQRGVDLSWEFICLSHSAI